MRRVFDWFRRKPDAGTLDRWCRSLLRANGWNGDMALVRKITIELPYHGCAVIHVEAYLHDRSLRDGIPPASIEVREAEPSASGTADNSEKTVDTVDGAR